MEDEHLWKHVILDGSTTHMQHQDKTLATYIWNIWNIHLQHMQHQIFVYNIQIKHMQHLDETYIWNVWNIRSSTPAQSSMPWSGAEVTGAELIGDMDLGR